MKAKTDNNEAVINDGYTSKLCGPVFYHPDSLSARDYFSIWRQTGYIIVDNRAIWISQFDGERRGWLQFSGDNMRYPFTLRDKLIKGYRI